MSKTLTMVQRQQALQNAITYNHHDHAAAIEAGSDEVTRLLLLHDEFPGEYDVPDLNRLALVSRDPRDGSHWVTTMGYTTVWHGMTYEDWYVPVLWIDLYTGDRRVTKLQVLYPVHG